MAKGMKILAVITGVCALCFLLLLNFTEIALFLPLAITFCVTAYHFSMRLLVGAVVNAKYKNKMNYERAWFRERRGERKFYRAIRVHKWKKFLPTYSPETFSMENKSVEEVLMATCQAEVVHEIIIILSFVPIICIPFLGDPVVFILTSVLSALFDLIFVFIQRFNRPRLRTLLSLQQKKEQ